VPIKVCEAPGCTETFVPKRPHGKYHSPACRQRALRNPAQAGPKPVPAQPPHPESFVAKYTEEELAKAGKMGTAAGQAALVLARLIDAGGPIAAVAGAVSAHAAAMERALRDGPADDPVKARQDEVTRRREAHDRAAAR
jgi:hypothetical protein